MTLFLLFAAIAAGLANPFQSGTNAELNKQLATPLYATAAVYASGLAALLLLQLILRQPLPVSRFAQVPWWAWLGGVISLVPTFIALSIAQRLGSTLFTGASITASLLASVLLDQFGLIGFKQHAASPGRLAGCALLVAGVWLIARF